MESHSYLTRLGARSRVKRRSFLKGTGMLGAGVAGAALIGCSSDDDGGGGGAGATGTSAPLATATAAPEGAIQQGGIWQGARTSDVADLDPLAAVAFDAHVHASFVYGRLLKFKVGLGEAANGDVEGDLASSFELADETTLIFKLRDGATWDSRQPTDGRPLDAEDVVFSWDKFAERSRGRTALARSAEETAPVTSVEALDDSTVQVSIAEPWSPIVPMLASGAHLWIMPRESDGGFDPRADSRGIGPWILEERRPDVVFRYRRNPDYYDSDRPYLEGFDEHIIPEYAQALAQFRAGTIWGGVAQTQDVVDLVGQLPDLSVVQNAFGAAASPIFFGGAQDSPFRDQRVRVAASRLIDREQWIRAFFDVEAIESAGLPVETRWNTHIGSGWDGWWMDPRSDEFGEFGANFMYDPAEAQRLLDAAGYGSGFEGPAFYNAGSQYGRDYHDRVQSIIGMLEAGGIRLQQQPLGYETEWRDHLDGLRMDDLAEVRDHGGLSFLAASSPAEIGYWLRQRQHSASTNTPPMQREAQAFDDLVVAQEVEFDGDRRRELVKDFQRKAAEEMFSLSYPGEGSQFGAYWPWARGPETTRIWIGSATYGAGAERNPHWWYDESKHNS